MDYVSGWQLVVDIVVIVYFCRKPKAQKRNVFQESKNTYGRDEQNRIESNRIKLIDNKVFQVSPIRKP